MEELILDGIQADNVFDVWNEIKPFLAQLRDSVPNRKADPDEKLFLDLVTRQLQLWIAHDRQRIHSMLITKLEHETGIAQCRIYGLAGSRLRECFPMFDTIKEWARERGATQIVANTKPSILKMVKRLGFKYAGDNAFKQKKIVCDLGD
jgi:hypothetical protein